MSPPIPRVPELDTSLALLREGYAFGGRRFDRYGTDAFRARLMGRPALRGREAARLLYEAGRTTRRRALPLTLLQDLHSVEMLDGADHRHRKDMFVSVMGEASLYALADAVEEEWRAALSAWGGSGETVLVNAARAVLGRAVCRWSGLPVSDAVADQHLREFAAIVPGAGAVGPRNWRGQLLRHRAEWWAGSVVRDIRSGALGVDPHRPAAVVAHHRGRDGDLLAEKAARVELINLLRPTVAVARFVAFAAVALHQHPGCRERVAADERYRRWFVQKVRRFFPFFSWSAAGHRRSWTSRAARSLPGRGCCSTSSPPTGTGQVDRRLAPRDQWAGTAPLRLLPEHEARQLT